MAFVLTPIYQPQFSPFGFAAPRQIHRYRGCPGSRRVQISPLNQFINHFDEILGEIDRQAQRQAHCEAVRRAHQERQKRKRALRAQFAVKQVEEGWQVDGEFQGFDQENITIEVTNDYTLKIAGNTEWHAEPQQDAATEKTSELTEENVAATESTAPTVTAESDTASEKSYQATVEDDFEDLGAEAASLISASSESTTVSEPKETKGKEKVVEEPAAEQTQEKPQEQEPEQERPQGSFEKTFQFPERIDATNVRASFKDGALTITVPRAPAPEAKRITIA